MIKSYKNYIIFYYILFAVAMGVAAFCDLKIDIFLNNPQNPVAIWFCNMGEIPAKLVFPLAGTLLFYISEVKWQKIVSAIIALGGGAYLGIHIAQYFFEGDYKWAFGVVFGLYFGVFLMLIGKLCVIPEEYIKGLRVLAIAGIILVLAESGVIEAMKYRWGRVRFRDLLAAGSYDAFTPWYHLNGLTYNKSFPSGHTGGAGASYLAMLLPFVFPKAKEKKLLCFALPLIYTSIVGFTRLVMGAHYLSDISMGGTVTFTIVLITIAVLDRKCKFDDGK